MKYIALTLLLTLPMAALAQDTDLAPESDVEEGFSLMEEGARLMFRGLMSEVDPTLDQMMQELEPALEMLASEMGPALIDLIQTLDSVRYYETPEILPNGDIIIRRSPDAPPFGGTAAPSDEDVIDL